MNFKKTLASVLIAVLLCSNVLAARVDLPEQSEEQTTQSSGQTEEKKQSNKEQSNEEQSNEEQVNEEQIDEEQADEEQSDASPYNPLLHPTDYYYNSFKKILELYVNNHLYETTEDEVLYAMVYRILEDNPVYFKYLVNSMLSTMDPYSSYHEAASNFLSVQNASNGFGITISDKTGSIIVTQVLADSNAQKAGFLPGDKLIAIGDYSVENLPSQAAMLILSKPYIFVSEKSENGAYESYNPECNFTIERSGQRLNIVCSKGPMTQSQFTPSDVFEYGKTGKTVTVKIDSFLGEDMDKQFNELIYGYEKDGINNITIDLRNNGGGSLEYAINMAETFVENGELLCYFNQRNYDTPHPVYSTTPKAKFKSITILVNKGTASAAELFANILQSKGIAKVIGEQTFGKGIGQSVYYLANGDYITITSYEVLDENYENYNGVGIKPDLEIQNVELLYELPELGFFNHTNYKEITEGEYNDATKALEDRLVIMGLMFPESADGIFDKTTSSAVRIYQRHQGLDGSGILDDATVSKITNTINGYKNYTYFEDSQYDVALIVHSSFSQGKRLVKEKQRLAEKEQEKIQQREKEILDQFDKQEAQKQQAAS